MATDQRVDFKQWLDNDNDFLGIKNENEREWIEWYETLTLLGCKVFVVPENPKESDMLLIELPEKIGAVIDAFLIVCRMHADTMYCLHEDKRTLVLNWYPTAGAKD